MSALEYFVFAATNTKFQLQNRFSEALLGLWKARNAFFQKHLFLTMFTSKLVKFVDQTPPDIAYG